MGKAVANVVANGLEKIADVVDAVQNAAAAPAQVPQVEQVEAAAPAYVPLVNRIGRILFAMPTANKPYTYADGRVRSTKAEVQIEVWAGTGIFIPGNVTEVRAAAANSDGKYIRNREFQFPNKGRYEGYKDLLGCSNQQAAEELKALRLHVYQEYKRWAATQEKDTPVTAKVIDTVGEEVLE